MQSLCLATNTWLHSALCALPPDASLFDVAVQAQDEARVLEQQKLLQDQQMSAKTTANVIASLAGALATALVESPVELFRHQAQARLL